MSLRQIAALAGACWRRLRGTCSEVARRIAQHRMPSVPPNPPAPPVDPAAETRDARGRFWSEFRAGQREAAARAGRGNS